MVEKIAIYISVETSVRPLDFTMVVCTALFKNISDPT